MSEQQDDIAKLRDAMRKALETLETAAQGGRYSDSQTLEASKFLLENAQGIAERFKFVEQLSER